MVVLHTFLFAFSLRLGSIIIGTVTLVKSSIWFIWGLSSLENISDFSEFLNKITTNQPIFESLADWIRLYENLEIYLITLTSFYCLEILICIFLLTGAYQCKPTLIYPFLVFYVFYFLAFLLDMILIYLLITQENDGLEIIIVYFTLAFFAVGYFLYTWCCVYSLQKVIKILKTQVVKKIKLQAVRQAGIKPPPKKLTFSTKTTQNKLTNNSTM